MELSARKRLARRIRLLRTDRGWSQEVLAELSGLNRSYIGAIERGEHNIGLDNIERLAAALETSIITLLNDAVSAAHTPEPRTGLPGNAPILYRPVIVHRPTVLQLMRQNTSRNRELVLLYLERCGAIVRD